MKYEHVENDRSILWNEALGVIENKLNERFSQLDEEAKKAELDLIMLEIRKRLTNDGVNYLENNDYFNNAMTGNFEKVIKKYNDIENNLQQKIRKSTAEINELNEVLIKIERLKKKE